MIRIRQDRKDCSAQGEGQSPDPMNSHPFLQSPVLQLVAGAGPYAGLRHQSVTFDTPGRGPLLGGLDLSARRD
jgi:hypothetical protein